MSHFRIGVQSVMVAGVRQDRQGPSPVTIAGSLSPESGRGEQGAGTARLHVAPGNDGHRRSPCVGVGGALRPIGIGAGLVRRQRAIVLHNRRRQQDAFLSRDLLERGLRRLQRRELGGRKGHVEPAREGVVGPRSRLGQPTTGLVWADDSGLTYPTIPVASVTRMRVFLLIYPLPICLEHVVGLAETSAGEFWPGQDEQVPSHPSGARNSPKTGGLTEAGCT